MHNILLYQQTLDPKLGQELLSEHANTINKHRAKWSGVLPASVIQSHAEAFALKAFQTYDPSKGAHIDTHLFNHLSKLSRLNYENQNTVRIPEHQIRQIGNYNATVNHLTDVFGREPEMHEIADHMMLPIAHVEKISKNTRSEYIGDGTDHLAIQTASIGATDTHNLQVQDRINSLPTKERKVFNALTNGMSPGNLGKQLGLKPYEVSRLKLKIAKHFRGIE